MKSTALTHERRNTTCTYERKNKERLLLRDGVHSIQYQVKESKAVTREIWSPQYLLTRDGVQIIYTRKMDTQDSWSKLHLPMRDGVQDIHS